MVQRVTYRRRHSYNTKSNRTKIVKTPGNKLTVQYRKKKVAARRCGDCGCKLQGMPRLRAQEATSVSKRNKTVTRPYGGTRCGGCVRQRIVRAFLVEEQKIVKRVLKAQQAKSLK